MLKDGKSANCGSPTPRLTFRGRYERIPKVFPEVLEDAQADAKWRFPMHSLAIDRCDVEEDLSCSRLVNPVAALLSEYALLRLEIGVRHLRSQVPSTDTQPVGRKRQSLPNDESVAETLVPAELEGRAVFPSQDLPIGQPSVDVGPGLDWPRHPSLVERLCQSRVLRFRPLLAVSIELIYPLIKRIYFRRSQRNAMKNRKALNVIIFRPPAIR